MKCGPPLQRLQGRVPGRGAVVQSRAMNPRLFSATVIFLLVSCSLVGCMMGWRAFHREDLRPRERLAVLPASTADRLDVEATVVGVDPLHGTMKLALAFRARGQLLVPGTRELARDIELLTDSAQGQQSLLLHRHRVPHPVEITLDLDSGDVSLYPLDRYTARFEIEAHATGEDGEAGIPLQVDFLSRQHVLHVEARLDPGSAAHEVELRLQLERPAVARAFAWFMNGLMVVVAGSAVIVAFNVAFRNKKPEANLLVWMSALLFVLPAFRNMLPGSPPLGALSDYLVFFWVEGLVALCLLLMVLAWYRRGVAG